MSGLADFPPLVPGEGLTRRPGEPAALRARMAEVYGVSPDQVLPTRGATHALELVLRAARLAGAATVSGRFEGLPRLAAIYGLTCAERSDDVRVVSDPADLAPGWTVVDETLHELSDRPSAAAAAIAGDRLVVLRSLSGVHGLAGARCGAAIGSTLAISALEAVLEPHALPGPTIAAAEAVLSPSRALALAARVRLIRSERARIADALDAQPLDGPFIAVPLSSRPAPETIARFGLTPRPDGDRLIFEIGPPEYNDRILAAFGVPSAAPPRRRGEAVRDTKETRIAATVDLDRAGETTVRTGVGFFDHMLEQVAAHGGFSLTLACEGDLHTDPHHTIEDSALALGAALKQALGDRRGIGRYGFVAPMDEAEAAVSLDLSGRPYNVFEGRFRADRIGDYPTALTAHVFRSLADSLGAAIHVRVTGDDDHHKTEVCFKAFGRALRQAIRLEGGDIPSTKGVL